MKKSAFSLIELIISITIVILLGVVGTSVYTSSQSRGDNTRIIADMQTIDTALLSMSQSQTLLPLPNGNTNYYSADSSYREPDAQDRFGVYGKITQDTLPKSYINFVPIDPVTGNYYSYGKTFEKQSYEIAAVVRDDDGRASAHVQGKYIPDNSLYNLIREHNGPRFVYHGSQDIFPYDPDDNTLHGKITEFAGTVQVNGEDAAVGQYVFAGDRISVAQGEMLRIYFSDGSQSILGDSSSETNILVDTLIAPEENSLITQVQLILNAGTIWTNATQMGDGSSLSIQAGDTTAAVRGTIFGISSDGAVEVVSGEVEITTNGGSNTITNTSTNNGSVASISTTIRQGIGYLEAGLFTQIIEYDSDTQLARIAINDTILSDAQYLKVGNDSSSYLNDGSWDSENTGSHDFDMNRVSGQSDVMLAFCKQQNFQEICSRPTALNTTISYDPNSIAYKSEDIIFNGDACENTVHTIDTRIYNVPNLKSGSFTTLSGVSDSIDNGSAQYSVFVSCNDGALIYEAEAYTLSCNEGFHNKSGSCVAGFAACSPGNVGVYSIDSPLPHSFVRSILVNDVKIENGSIDYDGTLRCDNGSLKIVQTQAVFDCNEGYEEDGDECIKQYTVKVGNEVLTGYRDSSGNYIIDIRKRKSTFNVGIKGYTIKANGRVISSNTQYTGFKVYKSSGYRVKVTLNGGGRIYTGRRFRSGPNIQIIIPR